jgi:hypothetical protein
MSVLTSSGTATVSINQSEITGATAATNAQVVRFLVKNTTGTTIPKGSAVYVSGATGDNALISLASATSDPSSSKTLGITAEAIANDAFGYVIEAGYLTDIDTSATTAGAAVWLGNTPGSLVFVSPPAEPSHAVYLGVVVRVQAINGSILVKVQNGYELDELHDVSAASPTDLDILQYKSSSSLWTKASIANAGIASSVHTHDYQASGTYVNSVIGTSPASVSTSSGTSTVSIIGSSIDSSHLADNAVVAAKIAANAVGVVAINSGSSTNSTVLTADGSGGASFLPFATGATMLVGQAHFSGILINSSSSTIEIGQSTATTQGTGNGRFCIDETSGNSFQIVGRNSIVKSTLSTGAVVSTTSYTALTANEYLSDIDINTGSTRNVCAISSSVSSTTTQVSKYYIIDPSAMTVKNSGNLAGATGSLHFRSRPYVKYDKELQAFTIMLSVYTGAIATGAYRGVLREVHPTTYATRVHTFPSTEGVPQTDTVPAAATGNTKRSTNPIYISSYTGWIHAFNNDQIQFYTDNAAASQFLVLQSTFSSALSGVAQIRQLRFDTYNGTTLWMDAEPSGSGTSVAKILLSSISSGFTTTGAASFSATGWTTPEDLSYSYNTFDVWVIGGKKYIGSFGNYIVEESLFANSYSDGYWKTPTPNTGAFSFGNVGTLYSDNGTAKFLTNISSDVGSTSIASIRNTLVGSPLSIDFVNQTSSVMTRIGLGGVSQSGGSSINVLNTSAINGSFDSAGIGQTYASSGSGSIRALRPGYTFRYRYLPTIDQSNTTVTLPYNWVIKQ